jgi:hypothetical protein
MAKVFSQQCTASIFRNKEEARYLTCKKQSSDARQ